MTQKADKMKKTKAVKKANKRTAKKAVKSVKLTKSVNTARETVKYIFDNAKKIILSIAHVKNRDTQAITEHKLVITQEQIKELKARVNNLKRFYSYCNVELQLLKKLSCDAQAKKLHACTNTQYDSRKKLLALILQLSLSKAQQKAKAIKTAKESKSSKAKK